MRALPHRLADSDSLPPISDIPPRRLLNVAWACATAWLPMAVAAQMADAPQAPPLAPHYAPLPVQGGVEQAQTDWPAANAAVGAFARGHADIVAWEARENAAPAPAEATPATPGHPLHEEAQP